MARLLILTIVLIVYGSLYPWQLRIPGPNQHPLAVLIQNDSMAFLVRDFAVNVMVYLPLGLFAFLTRNSIWRSLLMGAALSTCLELAQLFVVGRVSSLLDVASNAVGTAVGVAAGVLWIHTKHRPTKHAGVALLIGTWIAYQTFPFVPRMHEPKIVMKATPEDVILFVAEALAVSALVNNKARYLALLMVLVPLKAIIYTRFAPLPEIICAAAIVVVAPFLRPKPPLAAAALATALVIHGLAPYYFQSTPSPFGWIPFQASFSSEWEPALTIMLGKIYPYAALLYLAYRSGIALITATLSTASFLAAIEAAQRYLPGRSAEIIDPLIALIMGWVFWSLEQDKEKQQL